MSCLEGQKERSCGSAPGGVVEDVVLLGHDLREAEDGLLGGGGLVIREEGGAGVGASVVGLQVLLVGLCPLAIRLAKVEVAEASEPAAAPSDSEMLKI